MYDDTDVRDLLRHTGDPYNNVNITWNERIKYNMYLL